MTLTLIAEILAGETLVSPGGAVDALTVMADADEAPLWGHAVIERPAADEEVLVLAGARPETAGVPG